MPYDHALRVAKRPIEPSNTMPGALPDRTTTLGAGQHRISQAADTYGHVQPDRHESAVEALDRYLKV